MKKSNSRLVWSDDPKDQAKIQNDKKPKSVEDSARHGQSHAWTAVFRLEKNGRGGKTVTVIDQLPKQDAFLRELCKELKAKCGSGGTYSLSDGQIEIQGDKRAAIQAIFTKRGIRFKGMVV